MGRWTMRAFGTTGEEEGVGRIERGSERGEGRGRRWGGRGERAERPVDTGQRRSSGKFRTVAGIIRAHTNDMRDPFVCALNGIFIAVVVEFVRRARRVSMNAVPVAHACWGMRIRSLDDDSRTRLLELDTTVLNSSIVSTDDHHGLDEDGNRVGAFVDAAGDG